ncbi:CPBP family intramembrane glutamic endopeptidase [Cerasicoccus arenae]|uniref:CAAX prenyl protease 2/Lysostaphin resistance protein A-like domain-containing protein n=1 Tax=Cerasicoccus arenae TaxID=424488 RepID=A0A8J3DB18_9BACT|nr:CPBP family intramembrane glutamic endopeptidase [Cerasicoccus arenae]MBK1857987.1 CPBP family intramembrane metalloprotease [Cerasicoccus arenae]GHB97638.1 hypothetical protein GCM10007047_11860 [Cerasicoccus arenae]
MADLNSAPANAPRGQLWLETSAVLVVSVGYVIFHRQLAFNGWFIGPLLVVIIGYLGYEFAFGKRRPRDFGLRLDNLLQSAKLCAFVFGPFIVSAFIYAAIQGVVHPLHFVYALLLYPVWGLIQQFAYSGILLGNLQRLGLGWWSIPITATAFSLVHYPSSLLMQVTAIGGLMISAVYYRIPNIWTLAVVHGVFGAFLYYVFRDKDPIGHLLDSL